MIPFDRIPPQDLDAERGLLSALLVDAVTADEVLDEIAAADLYADAHQRIYGAARHLRDASVPIDLVTLSARLRGAGHLEDVGGAQYLADLSGLDPTGSNVPHYAQIVRDHAGRRRLIDVATVALRDAQRGAPLADVLADLERGLLTVGDSTRGSTGWVDMGEAVRRSLDRVDRRHTPGQTDGRVLTGFNELDEVTGGLRPGSLSVIGARPSVGKTSLALGMVVGIAGQGLPSILYSLEMSEMDIGDRYLAMRSEVELGRIVGHVRPTGDEVRRLLHIAKERPPIIIDPTPSQTAARIASDIRRAVRQRGVRVAVVDYLGLIGRERGVRAERRDLELAEMTQTLKRVGRECDIPIVLLAQLNRQVENRSDQRPTLADLKDSGSIEADADVVILLKGEPFGPYDEVQTVTAIVAKNRQGPRCDVPLDYRRPFTRFENRDHTRS